MIHVEGDSSKRLITMGFSQRVDTNQMRRGLEELTILLSEIEPGFTLLTDLSDLECMETACAPALGEIMEACGEKGVKRIIRVVPDPQKDIGFGLMSAFHYGPEVRVVTHDNLPDALCSLAR